MSVPAYDHERPSQPGSEIRRQLIAAAVAKYGEEFFMIDPRMTGVRAAPFRIQTEKDQAAFISHASAAIDWTASSNAVLPGQDPPASDSSWRWERSPEELTE